MSIEVDGNGAWMFEARSCGELPTTPLHEVLRWALQQLHFGCWRLESDDKGENVTLVLGKDAAIAFAEPVVETAIEHERRRNLALNFAGLFAQFREQGIDPEHAEMAESARLSASENAYMNTDFYYAFEFANILRRVRENTQNTLLFINLPLRGRLPESVSRVMGEATRAYLFKLNRSCVCLCRALLEAALHEHVDMTELLQERLQERFRPKTGDLECLINVGVRRLGAEALKKAHGIRKAGNDAMHLKEPSKEPSDEDAWAVLIDTRELLGQLLATPRAANTRCTRRPPMRAGAAAGERWPLAGVQSQGIPDTPEPKRTVLNLAHVHGRPSR